MNQEDMTAHWGNCEHCGVIVVYAHHHEMSQEDADALSREDWAGFASCYLCDGAILWGGSDPLPFKISR